MRVKDMCSFLNAAVPVLYQESYDNSGLQAGDPDMEITSALLAFDATVEVIDEAASLGCGLVITHHPVIFHPLKSLTGRTMPERIIMKALRYNIAVYSAHTSLDLFSGGVSMKMAGKLGLIASKPLKPIENKLLKLAVFIPSGHVEKVRDALFAAGAGVIGDYDMCSFNAPGYGTFRGNENSNPFVGKKGEFHREEEIRVETILPLHLKNNVLKALLDTHPYEEPAYDIYPLMNDYPLTGLGSIGSLPDPVDEKEFLEILRLKFHAVGIRYSALTGKKIRKVALCGGAGASLIHAAIAGGADVFVTGDLKYHDFFEAGNHLLLADIGHYESEICSLEILHDLIIKKFPTFALRFSGIITNPINYF